MNLKYLFRNGKNSNLGYYLRCYLRYALPHCISKWEYKRLMKWYGTLSIEERVYIEGRVAYYCKLDKGSTTLDAKCEEIGNHTISNRKRLKREEAIRYASPYLFDTQEHTRHFSKELKWAYCFGDVTHVPEVPSIVKSRPLEADNRNSVVMKLDKNRHFVTIDDDIQIEDKQDIAIFRGLIDIRKENRLKLFESHFGNEMVDIGDVGDGGMTKAEWKRPLITLYEHLKYKFIFALEGNDVASNLKWVMSSNSVAVMPKPTCETWFMEGTLVGGEHYIEVKADFSDLDETLEYYIAHPEECKRITQNANNYVKQFFNEKREKLISLLVLQRYFEATSQM